MAHAQARKRVMRRRDLSGITLFIIMAGGSRMIEQEENRARRFLKGYFGARRGNTIIY
jgi:hypothetical protein